MSWKLIRKFRKCVSLILMLSFCFAIMPVAEAYESSKSTFGVSEYDYIQTLAKRSEDDLMESGYTLEDIKKIKSISFEKLIYERAFLSDAELNDLGYDAKKIAMFHDIRENGIASINENDVRALAGTCTGDIDFISWSSSEIRLSYEWEWDHCPFVTYIDIFGVRWAAIGTNGAVIDTTAGYLTSAFVMYYLNGGGLSTAKRMDFEENMEFNIVSTSFMVYDSILDIWAKEGSLYLQIEKDPSVTAEIAYVKIAGLYGHSIISIGAPSLSVGAGDGAISFSFSGGINIDNIAGCKYKFYPDGRKISIAA